MTIRTPNFHWPSWAQSVEKRQEHAEMKKLKKLTPYDVFASYANLQSFFQDSPALARIKRHAEKKVPQTIGAKECTDLLDEAKRLHLTLNNTHLYMIQTIQNNPDAKGGKIIESWPEMPVSLISDPKVKKRVIHDMDQLVVHFAHPDGICEAFCEWFIYLYLMTKDQFSAPLHHMIVLGKIFEKGGGAEPTLLQSLLSRKGKLLHLKMGIQEVHEKTCDGAPTPLFEKKISFWKTHPVEIGKKLQDLDIGAYRIRFFDHSIAYIKINKDLGFFIDPNRGIITIKGDLQGDALYNLVSQCTTGETNDDDVAIIPVTLRKTNEQQLYRS